MSYASLSQMRAILAQVASGAANDAAMLHDLSVASDTLKMELGIDFAGYDSAATARRFHGGGSDLLRLPYHQSGSLTTICPVWSDLINGVAYVLGTDYEIEDDDHTWLYNPRGWPRGRYEATAKWGYGSPPASIVQVCLELAVNLWIGSQGGQFSDIVGIEGAGAVGYQRALTNRQRMVLEDVKARYGNMGFA